MRRRLLSQAFFLVTAAVLVSGSGCGLYNPRHGMILRGDWSLELNRVPWLNSRTQSYDEVGEGCSAPGMLLEPPAAPGSCANASGAPVPCPTQAVAHRCPPAPLRCLACERSHFASATPPPQQVAHSRFHPVPTRPVFTPWTCPTSTSPPGPSQTPPSPQAQPERELIPTPAASQEASQPTRADRAVTSAAWIFQPEDAKGERFAVR